METIRIPAKRLGELALKEFCERCFWIKQRCSDKLPFQIFPGIFSSIDSYCKKLHITHFKRHSRMPDWFIEAGLEGEPMLSASPHHSRFQIMDESTRVLLTGTPDEVLQKRDGSLAILDYKTARFKPEMDDLLPMYEIQLNAYAYIAEKLGYGCVSELWLLYYDPLTEVEEESLYTLLHEDGFALRFQAHWSPVDLQTGRIPALLAQVRSLTELSEPPAGRSGCKNCQLLNQMLDLLRGSAISIGG